MFQRLFTAPPRFFEIPPESMSVGRGRHLHASFVIAVTTAFIATICYIIGFVSPYWIEAKRGSNEGFQRLGLWEVCFHNFIFPEDYVSKAYEGCWYIYYPEYKYIRFWLNPRECCLFQLRRMYFLQLGFTPFRFFQSLELYAVFQDY